MFFNTFASYNQLAIISVAFVEFQILKTEMLEPCHSCLLKVTPDLRGCPPMSSGKKNSYAHHFKGKHGKLYIVGKLNNVDFGKQYELPGFLIPQKKIAKMTAKITMHHSVKQMN